MSEEQAKAIVDAIDIIATERARQMIWQSLGKAGNTADCAEVAVEAKQLLKEILIREE